MKVLLVEDETRLADVLARNLRARGHEVSVRETVDAACDCITESLPDVLIVDVNLPDHSGWEILRRLPADVRDRLRVVVTSAAPISRKRIAEFKPDHTLQKPFPIEALLRTLQERVEVEAVGD